MHGENLKLNSVGSLY